MENNITDIFVSRLYALSASEIPERVKKQVKLSLIDYLGCALIGEYRRREDTKSYLAYLSGDSGRSVIIGSGRTADCRTAAFLNGVNAHALELDDGNRFGMLHVGAPILSSMLALCGEYRVSAERFISAFVTGGEAEVCLAAAIQPGHKLRGFHAAATCGAVGAAIADAVLLGANERQLKTALSAGLSEAAGLLCMIDGGSTLKPYNIGRAAAAGINAAVAAMSGFAPPADPLAGSRGFFGAYAGEVKEKYLTEGFGERCAVELNFRKPHAACRHSHAAIDAAMLAFAGAGCGVSDIEKIEIETYSLAIKGHDHKEASSPSQAKMSIPYSVAAAVCCGDAGYDKFEQPVLSRGDVLSLTEKVEVSESPELSALVPEKRGAVARIITKDACFEKRVDDPKGEPENPMSEQELCSKLITLALAAGKSRESAERLITRTNGLEKDFAGFLGTLVSI